MVVTYTGSDKRLQYLFTHGGGGGGADIWVGTLAEYTQQAAQIADGTTVLITDDEDNYITEYHVYSETEHVIGQWIDGSTLYEKTIEFGALPNAALKSVAHGISNLGICFVVSAFAKNSSNLILPIPYATYTGQDQIQIYINSTNINIRTYGNMSAYTICYVTLRYTKTS